MMFQQTAGSEKSPYAMGYSEEFLRLLARRSADKVAFHLLPHLRPGMKLLDMGCGPGTISVGLAQAVAPGELHGIDIEASQIAMAQAAAKAEPGGGNAHFQVGDVNELPFEDNTFDVVHCHAVLEHLPNLGRILAGVKRVLKPGGIFSAREGLFESFFFEPDPDGQLRQATEAVAKLLSANGGHPDLGKTLKGILLQCGFCHVRSTASFESFSDEEDRTFLQGLIRGWLLSPKIKDPAIRHGIATEQDFATWGTAFDEWQANPASFGAFAWGEAIAYKPTE